MHDCSTDVLAYHDDKVTLPTKDQKNMKARREANRTRLLKGLKDKDNTAPREFQNQGSYEMKTMAQHLENDYDIDDGVYFNREDLIGPRGGELTALQTRQMLRDAVDDGSFSVPPKVCNNCVRVQYQAGYHVDLPAYRRFVEKDAFDNEVAINELASSDWKRSDARDVTRWFRNENIKQSPDAKNGRQLRRITRLIKMFAKSRPSWEGQSLNGFGITKLVTEVYTMNETREDTALYGTMKAILDRPLFESDCTREKALKCWDKVFATIFFSERFKSKSDCAATNESPIITSGLLKSHGNTSESREAVRKERGGRYA